MGTDAEWEKWGSQDPYFGVITAEKFRRRNLTAEAREEFFDGGRHEIQHVLEVCRDHFDPAFSPKRALDFGCGVGRLVIPLSREADQVVGLDVSESMLEEARKNCAELAADNVRLLKSDDDLTALEGQFDLIHSFIVFQHIRVERGRKIFARLLDHLEEGGFGAIQFSYGKSHLTESYGATPPAAVPPFLRRACDALMPRIRNRAQTDTGGRDPEMLMGEYNVNQLLFVLQSAGISAVHIELTDHGGEFGAYLFFRKPKKGGDG